MVVYPGTFDPVTYGHIDIIKRASSIFRKVFVAVAHNPQKKPLFSVEERIEMLQESTNDISGIVIESFNCLLTDYVQQKGVSIIIKGLRAISDFEVELQMALTNRQIAPHLETIFMMTSERYSYLSSHIIKELAELGGKIDRFVPPIVRGKLQEKLKGPR
ncbi:MAG: Phosphopantetheine adenylyltransferase [Syntrophomonadaceae bacterium]|nr:Phosphopantetheine adenylyltransferase [Bacillota bacterium]MBT9138243.1 Phosphopantetheine adenylyltransferase [Bacillota bacterium]MBT9147112.1 Phosphopantetheine adenylyltransferase [Bacillota bacterium]